MNFARLFVALEFALTAMPPLSAQAAPFCAVFSYGRQCYYYTFDSCLKAAGARGACVTNDEDTRPPSGDAPFCVVASFGTQCIYYDAQACRRAAALSNGACAVNPNR